ncbi:hypothetical protein [Streptomyces sp. NPDC085529]|uniref:hypothetical protein n=1 Tax=Streptomyces sp. NPDC085529 TaxID=3365729 RepID=UPI0037D6CDEC
MFVLVCVGCGAELTAPLSRVALPAHARQTYGNGLQLPVLMEPGTFAVELEPWGPPGRRRERNEPGETAARGIHVPVPASPEDSPGTVVIAPGDTRGTVLVPEKRGGACCGFDGSDGPNLACVACGLPVASRIDDCSLWQAVWFAPNAVRRLPIRDAAAPLSSWADLLAAGAGVPPSEPIASWGEPFRASDRWHWSPQWVAAAGQTLAHLLVASDGRAVDVPTGLTATMFQRALDTLLPAGGTRRRAVLAGPGQPAHDDADILLVPSHPQTGEAWTPAAPARWAPLPFGVWLRLVFPEAHLYAPASGTIPYGVLRDDPPTPTVHDAFRIDWDVFQRTLNRLPAARVPWLREITDRLSRHRRTGLL